MVTVGILLSNIINTIVTKTIPLTENFVWRLAFFIQIIPAVLLVFICSIIPYSPRWLAEKGRHEEGQAVIAKLRGKDLNDKEIIEEYSGIQRGVDFEKSVGEASWSELIRPGIRRRLTIGIVNQTFQQLTGINIIIYYFSRILESLGIHDTYGYYLTSITFVKLLATLGGMWAIERFGRKPLLMWGGLLMGVSHILVYGFLSGSDSGIKAFYWIEISCFYLFIIFFAMSWGPVRSSYYNL
jgi:MFS transporter, SP family, sugar:H+ symporter